jgi:hypothetical protein
MVDHVVRHIDLTVVGRMTMRARREAVRRRQRLLGTDQRRARRRSTPPWACSA